MTDYWGDIPSWIMAIFTPISIFVGFIIARQQLIQTKKIEEQKFFFEINQVFMKKEYREISNRIYNEIYHSKPFDVQDENTERDLTNYLSELDYLCNLYVEGILSKKQLASLEGLQIVEAMKSESVRNYITNERTATKEPDLWGTVEEVAKGLE